MRICATLNERTVRRSLAGKHFGRTGLTVIDNEPAALALKVSESAHGKYILRVANKLGPKAT